jgi:hypothetical protein
MPSQQVQTDESHNALTTILSTKGAANDLEKATQVAQQLVTTFGMNSEVGPVSYSHQYKDLGPGSLFSYGLSFLIRFLQSNSNEREDRY